MLSVRQLLQVPELVPDEVEQVSTVTFDARWNPKRGEVTYRIGKQGTSAFLLLGADDIAELRNRIDQATKGTDYVRAT